MEVSEAEQLAKAREAMEEHVELLMSKGCMETWVAPVFVESAFKEKPKPEPELTPPERSSIAARELRLSIATQQEAKRHKARAQAAVDSCRAKLEKAEAALVEREQELVEADANQLKAYDEFAQAQKAEQQAEAAESAARPSKPAGDDDMEDVSGSPLKRRKRDPFPNMETEKGAWALFRDWVISSTEDEEFDKFALLHDKSKTLIAELQQEFETQKAARQQAEAEANAKASTAAPGNGNAGDGNGTGAAAETEDAAMRP